MDDERRRKEALFRHSVLGSLIHRPLQRGELKCGLDKLSAQTWTGPGEHPRTMASKTLEEWYYRYRNEGFDGLLPRPRKDRGKLKTLSPEIQALILAMKHEDSGRSAPLIKKELELAGRIKRGAVSVSVIQRFLKREGLSKPCLELERPVRLRWQAATCGELWQGDALHGPKLFDPASGREIRVKVFAVIDDRSRLVPYLRADFHETQADFLTVLMGAVLRRGVPNALLLDNHGSFTGSDVQLACAKLGVRLVFARPYDGPAKGKIERFWRTLRGHVLDRLDLKKIETLADLNVRLSAWVEGEYNRRPHAGLNGRTPLEVFEEDAECIRWIDDPAVVENAFLAMIERTARNDSTVQVHGKVYEVPAHLRDRKVEIGYSLLHPDRFFVIDGGTRVPLREVDPVQNARTSRVSSTTRAEVLEAPKTGLNPVEEVLKRITRPGGRREAS